MEIKENSEYLFASCEVNWKIENFVFAYPFNNYSILSPELWLQGLKTVYWKMSLELHDNYANDIADIKQSFEKITIDKSSEKASIKVPHENADIETSPENGLVSFYLEILPSSSVKNVFVNWEMTIALGPKVFGPFERTVTFQEHSSKHGHIGIATTNEIIQELLLLKDDAINIRFYFIAFDKDKFFIPKEDEKPLGMFHLFKDLKAFKDMEENYSDIKLKVHDEYIKAHKIVLSCNEKFDNYIKEAVNNVVEISDFGYRTLNAFVNFLYSQDVKYCLEELSTTMLRCLNHFKCDALKTYYFPEELPVNSKIEIKKFEFQWYVPDILHNPDFDHTSPPIVFPLTSTTWRLKVFKNGGDRNTFMSIFAEITEGNRPKLFSLEFALLNESDKEFFSRRLLRNNETYDNLGFNEFVKQSDITGKRWVVLSDCVCFLFRVIMSNGKLESSVGCHTMSFISPVKSKLYRQMSETLLEFYKKQIYGDIFVVCKGGNVRANRFILAARWPELRQALENNETSISIGWFVESRHIRVCLPYLYSGVLNEEVKSEVILELHNMLTSERLNIPILGAECEKRLMKLNACYNVKRKY